MRESPPADVRVRAEVRLLPTSAGGRAGPVRGCYRPIHNFFGLANRNMAAGSIELPAGSELHPGQSIEVTITFFGWPGLRERVYPGREWRIQEGAKLVGTGIVIEVL